MGSLALGKLTKAGSVYTDTLCEKTKSPSGLVLLLKTPSGHGLRFILNSLVWIIICVWCGFPNQKNKSEFVLFLIFKTASTVIIRPR